MARTTPICSLILALLLTSAPPAEAARKESPLINYARARVADADGEIEQAARGYAAALVASPANSAIAIRAFRQAVEAGDKALALRAARQLDAAGSAPPDAYILLMIERMERGDWQGARLFLERIEEHGAFSFMVPVSRAWIAYGAREVDPLKPLQPGRSGGVAASYVRDHEALMLLALGRKEEGLAAVRANVSALRQNGTMRIQAAARLAALGDKNGALTLLSGGDPASHRVAEIISANGRPKGAVVTPVDGVAALLARVAADLFRETASPAALTFARLSQFAQPENDANRISLIQTFARAGQNPAALDVLDAMPQNSIYRDTLPALRITLLERVGDGDAALKLAVAEADRAGAGAAQAVQLGDVLNRQGDKKSAVAAFKRALERSGGVDPGKAEDWQIWLSYGNALDGAGQWDEGKAALRKAVAFAPDQPMALNHLGYAMLERRDDVSEATRLIAKANALMPQDAAIADSLGLAYLLGGQVTRAVSMLEAASSAAPNEAVIGEHLGDAYWQAGRRIDARYAWRAAIAQLDEKETAHRDRLLTKIDFGPVARD